MSICDLVVHAFLGTICRGSSDTRDYFWQATRLSMAKQVELLVTARDWILGFDSLRICCKKRYS